MKKIKFNFFLAFLLFFIVVLASFYFFDNQFAWSFSFAFISFLSIVLVVFFAQKRKIEKIISNLKEEDLESLYVSNESEEDLQEETQENPKKSLKKKKFLSNFKTVSMKTGFKMFFVPLRILAYAFLVIGFFVLLRKGIFDWLGFVIGLATAHFIIMVFWIKIILQTKSYSTYEER
ncbi:MAG: hypothetical protein K2I63_02950 [Helicobacter sp.]|nr:hypothetical protein [Helicobacter sp.]